jgi:hypothetical protein
VVLLMVQNMLQAKLLLAPKLLDAALKLSDAAQKELEKPLLGPLNNHPNYFAKKYFAKK